MIKGIDLSHWNEPVDLVKAKADGVLFMSAKASEGLGSFDATCNGWLKDASYAGIDVRGVYHFFHPKMDGEAQARSFYLQAGSGLDFYVLDFEAHDNQPTDIQLSEAQRFLVKIQTLTGKIPWVYMGQSFADELGNPAFLAKYPLWLARYTDNPPPCPQPWTKWSAWQNSESGTVAGATPGDKIDIDWFDGSLGEFMSLLQSLKV